MTLPLLPPRRKKLVALADLSGRATAQTYLAVPIGTDPYEADATG
jgi:hypothetical protein